MKISTDLIPPGYVLDPSTEVLFLNGQQLRNGLVVLLADGYLRSSIARGPESYITLERARWCMVDDFYYEGGIIKFVGKYGDGTSLVRTVDVQRSWIVKRKSDPIEKSAAVRDILTDALMAQFMHYSASTFGEPPNPDDYVEKIMALFEEKS